MVDLLVSQPLAESAAGLLRAIIAETNELFPGKIAVSEGFDPEWPDDTYLVFHVTAQGEAPAVVERQLEWHRRMAKLASLPANHFRLSIDMQDA